MSSSVPADMVYFKHSGYRKKQNEKGEKDAIKMS